MKILLETADLAEIRWATQAGLIDGVTTHPALLDRVAAGRDHRDVIAEICAAVPGPVSADVAAVDVEGIFREGKDLARLAENVVVKVPVIEEGLAAARRLSAEGVAVNVTLVCSAMQALLAAKAGAAFVSPAVGPLDDAGHDGIDVVRQVRAVFGAHELECEVVAASIRNAQRALHAALAGADAVTVPAAVLRQMLVHPLTDRGVDQLLSDWSRLGRGRPAENRS